MNKRLLLLSLPLLLLVSVLGGISLLPGAHAANPGTLPFCSTTVTTGCEGGVCLNDATLAPATGNPCQSGPFTFNGPFPHAPETANQQIRVGVYLNSSLGMGGFTVILNATHTVLKAAGIDLTGSLIFPTPSSPAPQIFAECLGGILIKGPACNGADGADTLDLSAGLPNGAPNTLTPTNGLLFTAIFNITGTAPVGGIGIAFQQSAQFCSTSSTAQAGQPGNFCVFVSAPPSTVPAAETVQTGTLFDNSGNDVTWVALTATPTSFTGSTGGTATATITATAENGFPGLFSGTTVTFSAVSTNGFPAPTFSGATCSPPAASSCSVTAMFNTANPGQYTATIFGSYVGDNSGNPTGACATSLTIPPCETYTLVGVLNFQVSVQDVAWILNGNPFGSNQNVYMAKNVVNYPLLNETIQSEGGYTGTVTLGQSSLTAGLTGITKSTYPAPFVLLPNQRRVFLINATATAYGTALLHVNMTATSFATRASGTLTIHPSGFTTVANTTAPPSFQEPTGSAHVGVSLQSLGSAATTDFAGTVTLLSPNPPAGLSVACTSVALTAGGTGSGTCTLTATTPGTYTFTIQGLGGANNAMTNSTATISVTVTPAPDFTITANPATVPASVNTPGTSMITIASVGGFTGTVALTSDHIQCTLTPPSVPGGSGTSTLSCTFAGAGTFIVVVTGASGSLSHAVSVTYNVASLDSSSTSVVCAPSSISIGGVSTCTVTVTDTTNPAKTPTGTVSFTSSATSVGTVGANCSIVSGSCSVSFTGVAPGSATVTGTYGGDTTHSGSTGTSGMITVTKDITSTTVGSVTCQIPPGQPSCTATVTASVSDTTTPASIPSGSVSFTLTFTGGTLSAPSCTLVSGGCSVTFTGTASGTGSVAASYGGDSTHNTSSGSASVTVTSQSKDSTSTTVSCSPSTITPGGTSTCSVTVTDTTTPSSVPSGSVSFTSSNSAAGTVGASCTLSSGSCTVTATGVASGTFTVTGNYAGDTTHSGSSGTSNTVAVQLDNTSTSVTCTPASVSIGGTSTCSATVSDTTTPANVPGGSVSFTSSSSAVGTVGASCSLVGGSCSVSFTGVAPGSATVSGIYGGDTTHKGSTGTSGTITVTKDNTSTSVPAITCQIVLGQTSCTATVTATVTDTTTPASTPSGSVSFTLTFTGGSLSASSCTLVSGSCSVTFTGTSAGTGSVAASYSGDTTHDTSSTTASVTVTAQGKDSTSTAVSCSPITILPGGTSTCTTTVSDTTTPTSVPTGVVNFLSSNTAFGTVATSCTLTSGSCSVSATGVAAGTFTVAGTYAGDTTHNGSSGTSNMITVQLDNTSTSVSCLPISISIGGTSSCTVTVSDTTTPANVPSGTVSFASSATTVGTVAASCTLVSGSCSVSFTGVGAGSATVTGTYAGDTTHNGSMGTSGTITVTKDGTSTSVGSVSCQIVLGQTSCTAMVTATVTDTTTPSSTPSGSVSFSLTFTGGTLSASSCTLVSGSCSVTFTGSTAGTGSVGASYGGDATHNTSITTASITVTTQGKDNTSTTVACSPSTILPGGTTACTATVVDITTSTNVPTGSVSFLSSSTAVGTVTASCTLISGSCSVTATGVAAGTFTITGTYGADTTHNGSAGTSNSVTVQLDNTSTSVTCTPASITAGGSSSCTATVSDTTTPANAPSGMVAFTSSDTTVGTVTASCTLTSGSCSVSATGVAAGSFTVTGTYAGDLTHNGSVGVSAAITVSAPTKDNTSTSVSCTPASINIGATSACTATVADTTTPTNIPTGTVSFQSSDTTVGTVSASCTLTGGSCNVMFTGVAPGTATVTGTYGGDSSSLPGHNGSVGTSGTITVVKDDTSTSVSCSSSVTVGLTGSCSVAIADVTNVANVPSGTVTLTSSDTTKGTVASSCALTSGSCTVTITGVAAGSFTVTGTYAGDSSHNGSSGTSGAITVSTAVLDNTSTTVSCAPASINIGALSTCTVTVADTSTPTNTPTGTLSFTSSATTVGTVGASCSLVSGSCTVSFTGVSPGSATVTGNYAGDITHNGSSGTSNAITVLPDGTSTSVGSVSCQIVLGQSSCTATVSATVTDTTTLSSTPSGTVSLSLTFTGGTLSASSCTLVSGSCSVTFTGTAAGTGSVSASYGGDATHSMSSGSSTVTVSVQTLDSTSTTISCAASVNVGATGSCNVTVADTTNAANTPTGTVALSSSDNTIGTVSSSCTLSAGTCSVTITGVSAGSFTVAGTYAGDATHNGSTGTSGTITVLVVAPPDFLITANPTTVTMSTGVTGTSTINVSPVNGFSSTVSLTVATNSTNLTCTLSITSISGGSGTSTLSCQATVAGTYLATVTGTGGGITRSATVTFTVTATTAKVLLTFKAFDADDFDNGVGQLQVFVNGNLVVDIPAGLNHLSGSGDFTAYTNTWISFGPFDITAFVHNGQNNITFADLNPSDHFTIVKNVLIVQGSTTLLNVKSAAAIFPGHSRTYTFSIPPLVLTSFTVSSSTPVVDQVVSLNATYTGGTAPFVCIFGFGDGEFGFAQGVNGSCSATHDYDQSGTFKAFVIIKGASTSDLVKGSLTLSVIGDPSPLILPALIAVPSTDD